MKSEGHIWGQFYIRGYCSYFSTQSKDISCKMDCSDNSFKVDYFVQTIKTATSVKFVIQYVLAWQMFQRIVSKQD